MKIIALGDVVGPAGVAAVASGLRRLKREENADLVIVNAENAYAGNGLDIRSAEALLAGGADILTGGNHSLRLHDTHAFYDENDFVLRPHNYPKSAAGKGYTVVQLRDGCRVLVMNLAGQVFMDGCDMPFPVAEELLARLRGQYDISVCDFHAEATSEKNAFFLHFDGRINVMFGTHTHVQTADERLLSKGSGVITDLGMCGVTEDSVLGVKLESVIGDYTQKVHNRFEKAEGKARLCGAVFTVDRATGYVTEVKRIATDV